MSATLTMPRKPGRPRVGSTRDERVKHIKCTYFLLLGGYSSAALARMHGVGRSTVYNWRDLVLEQYDDPEAEGLRRMVAHADDARGNRAPAVRSPRTL